MRLCIAITVILLVCTPNVVNIEEQSPEYYCEDFSLFATWFTEPVESAYFYWVDGSVFKLTSYQWNTISCSPSDCIAELKHRNLDIRFCLFIIHNHLIPSGFSAGDRGFHNRMKKHGFVGMFLLYCNGKTYILRD